MDWATVMVAIADGKDKPASDTHFYFTTGDGHKENYHIMMELDYFLDFWADLSKKFPGSKAITMEEFKAESKGRIVRVKAIQPKDESNVYGYVEFYIF